MRAREEGSQRLFEIDGRKPFQADASGDFPLQLSSTRTHGSLLVGVGLVRSGMVGGGGRLVRSRGRVIRCWGRVIGRRSRVVGGRSRAVGGGRGREDEDGEEDLRKKSTFSIRNCLGFWLYTRGGPCPCLTFMVGGTEVN
jgi:hypothetical protein